MTASDPSVHACVALRDAFLALLDRLTAGRESPFVTEVPGLRLYRFTHPEAPHHSIATPGFSAIAQGAKQLLVGDEVHGYDPFHYMVSSVDLPVVGGVTRASEDAPYLGMKLLVDADELGELIRDPALPAAPVQDGARGLYVHPLGAPLLDAVCRLLRLLDTPADIPILAPMLRREIFYRLLMDGQGGRLRQMALQDSSTQRVAQAIRLLRERFADPLRMETLARDVHMSVSSLHHHFKAVTAMSPLQYQKQLRLHEARRLMLAERIDAAAAAHRVGYGSPSQFSREYVRQFGTPPSRDRRRWLAQPPGG